MTVSKRQRSVVNMQDVRLREANGRFIKKKVLERKRKAATNRTLQAKATKEADDNPGPCAIEGRRIIDVKVLHKNMWCVKCKQGLCFRDVEGEQINGLNSVLHTRCPSCNTLYFIHTSDEYTTKTNSSRQRHVVNAKLAAGIIDAGIGATQMNSILTAINIPAVSTNLLRRAEGDIGPSVNKIAKQSCADALAKERELTLKKALQSTVEFPDPNNAMKSTVVGIAASYDMGYGTRGTGRTYDSFTGHASLFGHETKKLIGFTTKMRKCYKCDNGHDTDSHVCQGVYDGTAKSMESAAAVDLMSDKNEDLSKANVRVDTFIGDGDSAGISKVRANCTHPVMKWLDINHTIKSLNNLLYSLKQKHRFECSVIDYLKNCFSYALAQNRNNVVETEKAIKNVVNHAFEEHDLCGSWCKFKEDPENYRHKGLPGGKDLTGNALRNDLTILFNKFVSNAASLAPAGSTQSNESFNNVVVRKAPKNNFFGGTSSHHYRVAAAAAQTNLGTRYISEVFKKLGLSPGSNTEKLRQRQDYWRKRRQEIKKTVSFKSRRLELKLKRKQKRNQQGRKEGVSYMSDVAFIQTITNPQPVSIPKLQIFKDSPIVFVDIETTGFFKNSEIIQVAAKCLGPKGATFSMFAYPQKSIPLRIQQLTGVSMEGGQMFLRGEPVQATNLATVMTNFVAYLTKIEKPVVLIGHNAMSFDFPRLYKALSLFGLLPKFSQIVCGFADSYQIFKADANIANKEPSLKQPDLAQKYIAGWLAEGAHEALDDCKTLEKICHVLVSNEKIIECSKPTSEFIAKQIRLAQKEATEPELQDLKSVLSNAMIKRLAEHGIGMKKLEETYLSGQEKAIQLLLAEDEGNGKARITNNKKIIAKLSDYFKQQFNSINRNM